MRTFYRDETKATGWNNLVFPNVGMPHVLVGDCKVCVVLFLKSAKNSGHKVQVFKGWEQVTPGTHERLNNTIEPWLIWWATCNGWVSLHKANAFVWAFSSCCSCWAFMVHCVAFECLVLERHQVILTSMTSASLSITSRSDRTTCHSF